MTQALANSTDGSTPTNRAAFDYSALDTRTAELVRASAHQIHASAKRVGSMIISIGAALNDVSGYDTPETGSRADCEAERRLGEKAKDRLAELLRTPGLRICDSGEVDRYGRPLVWVRLPDERSAGAILLAEGLARPWPSSGADDWC